MANATHTPGPWRFGYGGIFADRGNLLLDDMVCGLKYRDVPTEVVRANARLIAAAPDLLEVLKQCLKRGWMWDNDPELYDAAAKVIRKAKGE